MISFYINPATGDVEIDGQNCHKMIDGDDEIVQCVGIAFNVNKGEWFADPEHGFRRHVVQRKKYDEVDIQNELYNTALQESRVDRIEELNFDYERQLRKLTIDFQFTKENGELVKGVIE